MIRKQDNKSTQIEPQGYYKIIIKMTKLRENEMYRAYQLLGYI